MSDFDDDFIKHAKLRTCIERVQRMVQEHFMVSDLQSTPKEVVACEEAPRGFSEIKQEDWQAFLNGLSLWENHQRQEITKYKMVRVDTPEFFKTKIKNETNARPKKSKPAKKRKSKPEPQQG